jgi:hypothetical protein
MNDTGWRIGEVARVLLGDPSQATSRQLRYGQRGSLSIDLRRQVWHDHEIGQGGGTLDLIRHVLDCDASAAGRWYAREIEGRSEAPPAPRERPPAPAPDPADLQRRLDRARALWARSEPAAGTVVQAYLERRGLWLPDDAPLRLISAALHGESRSRWPAMIAPIVAVDAMDNDAPQGVHLTYLTPDGRKAAVAPNKRVIGVKRGGVIKIAPDETVVLALAISEGIETGLTMIAQGLPCWCAVDAGGVAAFPLLNGVQTLHVGVDHDPAGQRAASAVSRRWSEVGWEVLLHTPGHLGADWADQAQPQGDTI